MAAVAKKALVALLGGIVVAVLAAPFTGVLPWSLGRSDDPSADHGEIAAGLAELHAAVASLEAQLADEGLGDDTGETNDASSDDGEVQDALAVQVFARAAGDERWEQTGTEVRPGNNVDYMIRLANMGETTLRNAVVGVNLANHQAYIENSTFLKNSNHPEPKGTRVDSNNLTTGGINIGHYAPGSVGYVLFSTQIDPVSAFEQLGRWTLKTVGIVSADGMNEYYNTAHVAVTV